MMLWFQFRISRKARLHGAALLFFALLALICLYPIIVHYQTHGAGYDNFFYHWSFWWVRHALSTDDLSVYENNFVMYPFTSNYGYDALTAAWFPAWAALEPVGGTLLAVTAILFIGCVLNGYVLFALLLDEGIMPGLALLGGAALQLFPISRYFYYNSHLNLMDWFWLPVCLLLWKRIVAAANTGRARRLVVLALFQGIVWWAVALTDLQFPIFVAFVLGPYGLLTLYRSRRRGRLVAAGIAAGVLTALLLWFLGPLRYILKFDAEFTPGPVEDRPVIAFPDGFLSMSGTWWDWSTPSLGAFISLVFLASAVFALFRFSYLRSRLKNFTSPLNPLSTRGEGTWLVTDSPSPYMERGTGGEVLKWPLRQDRWFWLLVALPPLAIAIGPTLRIGDHVIALPPFRLVYAITEGNFRMPWRLAPVFVIAAALFAGKVWTPPLRRWQTGRIWLLAGAFFLLAVDIRLYETGPLRPLLPNYATYAQMGQERGDPYDDYVVLEVPTGAGTGEVLLGDPEAIRLQYYGIVHGKRMVNGFISRAPLEHFWYLHVDDPMLAWLGQRRLLDEPRVIQQLRERIFEWPIGYLVVHQDFIRRNSVPPLEITGFLNSLDDLLCAPVVEGDAVFYRTAWHPDGCTPRTPPESESGVYTVDVGVPDDVRYLGWGWHAPEMIVGLTLRWAGDHPQSQVYIDLPPGAYTVTVSMQAFEEPRRVSLVVNGMPLAEEVTVSDESLRAYTFDLPTDVLAAQEHTSVRLDYDGWRVPAEIGQSTDQRRLSVAVDWLRFERVSQGE